MLTQDVLKAVVNKYNASLPRSTQTALGVSDIGGCREFARLKVTGTEPTDHRDKWAAFVGTAVHKELDEAVRLEFGDNVLTGHETLTTYPGGATMIGHPDWVFPDLNLVVDVKSVDGLNTVRKNGPSNRQWMQVMGYGQALIDEGTFTADKPVLCVILYVDRSARDSEFVSFERELDPIVLAEAADWISDVVYSVEHGEEASKDKPIDWCIRFCEFYTACRAEDAAPHGGLIEDEDVVNAVDLYLEGMELEKRGKALKNEAKGHLEGVDGSTGKAIVRWTMVSPAEVPGYTRDGYKKLNIRPVK